jgi:hypothetical protein
VDQVDQLLCLALCQVELHTKSTLVVLGPWKIGQNCVEPMIDQVVSAENPWPNTATQTVLVCRIPKKDDKPSANEFVDKDGRICRWVVMDKK